MEENKNNIFNFFQFIPNNIVLLKENQDKINWWMFLQNPNKMIYIFNPKKIDKMNCWRFS